MVASSVGISYQDFLLMNPKTVKAFSDGYQRKINREAWLNGLYFRDALMSVLLAILPRKCGAPPYQYPVEPHHNLQPMTEKEKDQLAENERLRAKLYCDRLVRMGKNWGK